MNWCFQIYIHVQLDDSFFGAIIQYPNSEGSIEDYRDFINAGA
ncbi:MAG: hypothetical protein WKF59_11355 [Chitinophagaceae bacterium]